MISQRNLKQDLFALLVCAVTIFLAVSLLSYNPADTVGNLVAPLDTVYQPDVLVLPETGQVSNACGRLGAAVADLLYTFLGYGAFYLIASLAVLAVVLLRRICVEWPALRCAGWLISLTGITALLTLVAPLWTPGPVIGPGGILGALSCAMLRSYFATTGGIILAGSLAIGGILLTTDYMLFRFVGFFYRIGRGIILGILRLLLGRAQPTTDFLEQDQLAGGYEEGLEDDEMMPVVVRGKRVPLSGEEYQEVDEEVDWEEEWHQEPASPPHRQPSKEPHFEVSAARVSSEERERMMARLDRDSQSDDHDDYELPGVNILWDREPVDFDHQAKEVRRKAHILERTFSEFGFKVKVVEIVTGPVLACYEVELEAGLRLSRITGLGDDLAIALRVPTVRVVSPIPGKNTVGIEVPNNHQQLVRLREVIEDSTEKVKNMRIPIFIGKDVSGSPLVVDLTSLPHLLIAGRTGSGKSVCLHAIIASILMTRSPEDVRLLMIDPKMVELSGYGRPPHLMHPVVTDMKKAEAILAWAVEKMEERYSLLARAGVRHITSYNQLGEKEIIKRLAPESEEECQNISFKIPFVVIVADELADLMMTGGKEIEQHIIRLAQKSRAVGIHLILATQKPTVDVITGLIKSNLPARLAFQVASRMDSRVVLDEQGAERLLGNGDLLFLWPGTSTIMRAQGTYLDDDEINALVDEVSTDSVQFDQELIELKVAENDGPDADRLRSRDELYESAIEVVVRERRGSLSLLQRTLGIGYGRAARLIDFMAEDGIVGDYNGSKSREVLLTMEEWETLRLGKSQPDGPAGLPGNTPAPVAHEQRVVRPKRAAAPLEKRDRTSIAVVDDASPETSVAVVTAGRRIEAPPEGVLEGDDWKEELVEDFDQHEAETSWVADVPQREDEHEGSRPVGDFSAGDQEDDWDEDELDETR
ncbi:MAG: DNA translocase FtsK 4TM domain-containing protein [Pirellulaceae bacterium]